MNIINVTFASETLENAYNNKEQDIVRIVDVCHEFARRETVYKYAEVEIYGSFACVACGNEIEDDFGVISKCCLHLVPLANGKTKVTIA